MPTVPKLPAFRFLRCYSGPPSGTLHSHTASTMVRRMNQHVSTEQCVSRLAEERRALSPCTVVIFGASGDLTARKLIPALYHLFIEKALPTPFRVVGFARREKTHDQWRAELRAALDQFSRTKPVDEGAWQDFEKNLHYFRGDFSDREAYKKLADDLNSFGNEQLRHNLLFY